jgi:hypothetical protein
MVDVDASPIHPALSGSPLAKLSGTTFATTFGRNALSSGPLSLTQLCILVDELFHRSPALASVLAPRHNKTQNPMSGSSLMLRTRPDECLDVTRPSSHWGEERAL